MCKAGRRPSPKIKKRNEEIYRLFEIGFRTQSEIAKEYGLMAPRVMICAAHQANTIVELIVKHITGETEE